MTKCQMSALCNLDVDNEKERAEILKSTEESIGYLKSDDSLAKKTLQREIFSHLGGKFMQFLMNHNPELPKVASKDECVNNGEGELIDKRTLTAINGYIYLALNLYVEY